MLISIIGTENSVLGGILSISGNNLYEGIACGYMITH